MATEHPTPISNNKASMKNNLGNTQSESEKSENSVQEASKTKSEANTSSYSTWLPYMDGIAPLPKGMHPEQLNDVINLALYPSRTASRFLFEN
jgi:hypothetical protein